MLPEDIRRLILEFHDSYDIMKKRTHVNLIIKSAFRECVAQNKFECELYEMLGNLRPCKVRWTMLLIFLDTFDKRLKKILENESCYSKLWTGVVPWD